MSTAPDIPRIPHVVVVGAGYTGLMCAVDLARRTRGRRRPAARITLVNRLPAGPG